MEKIKLILADDHQLILDGIRALLHDSEKIEIIAEAANGQELIDYVKVLRPDVALIDIDMPVKDGFAALEEIVNISPTTKCIMLTMHNEKGLVEKAIEMGASGYLLKTSNKEQLQSAIEKVFRGEPVFLKANEISNNQSSHFQYLDANSELIELTQREREILKLIIEGFSNKEIGDKLHISNRTVDTHRTNMMKKLDVHNLAGLIRFAMKHKMV
jgi:DNA-binding NarL/FixJ family response regulator